MKKEFAVLQQALEAAAKVVCAKFGKVGYELKGKANLVTAADVAAQKAVLAVIRKNFPQHDYLAEENGLKNTGSDFTWVVDPIDGTTNFVKDYKASAISVAMTQDGAVELGLVYNPYLDEMFTAQRGKGAYCNGRPIHVSDQPLEAGLTLYGSSSYYPELIDDSFRLLRKAFDRSMDIRRSGSAALDLCSIAAGRAELYFELRLQPWDYAAGSLIVREAGGKISRVEGGDIDLTKACSVLATGSKVDAAFLRESCSLGR